MVLSSLLTKALKLSLALTVAAPLALATGALAQQTKRSPLVPEPYKNVPWQKALDKLYRPANPQSDLDKAKRTLFRDPGRKLGLPSHGIKRPTEPNAPVVAPVTLDPAVSHLDSDGDGAISQSEYFQGRSRQSNIGIKTNRNDQRRTERLRSQFRRTDSNGDGKVSPDELKARGTGRF
ncbi:MAG: EF-hand domain-containing protein [Proteobacteria bacterium]|nr:EF-hand domain-containing protein [Pseudomonadota bacterium]